MLKTFFNSQIFNNYNKVQLQQSTNIGYDVILNQNKIMEPPKEEKRSDIFFINKAPKLMNKIYAKNNLDENDVVTSSNEGDGNCFFHVLSQFFYYKQIYHLYYRKVIAKYIFSKKEKDKVNFPFLYRNTYQTVPYEEYINEVKITGTFAGQYEIINAAINLNCNIVIYTNHNFNDHSKKYTFIYETTISPQDQLNPFVPIILIGWVNYNHFILLFPKDFPTNLVENINIFNLSQRIPKKENNNNISKLPNIQINEKTKNKDDNQIIDNERDNKKYNEYLTSFVNNKYSIYPELKGTKFDETKLEDNKKFFNI